jgi:hypothetical protein
MVASMCDGISPFVEVQFPSINNEDLITDFFNADLYYVKVHPLPILVHRTLLGAFRPWRLHFLLL